MNLRTLQRPLTAYTTYAGPIALMLASVSASAAPTPNDAKGLWMSGD